MDLNWLKKRNRLLLTVVIIGLLCFILIEWMIVVMQNDESEWKPVNKELEEWFDWETEFVSDEPRVININEAMEPDLMTLTGIGPSKAKEIINYRETHGRFTSIEQIMEVPGIGPATFEKLKDWITIGEVEEEDESTDHPNEES